MVVTGGNTEKFCILRDCWKNLRDCFIQVISIY